MNAFNELTFNTSEAYGVTELEADKKQLVDRYKQQMRETIDRNRDNICGMIILAETGSMFFTPQEVLAEIDRFPAEWQQRTELTTCARSWSNGSARRWDSPMSTSPPRTPTTKRYRSNP